jgi:hypothetical protein
MNYRKERITNFQILKVKSIFFLISISNSHYGINITFHEGNKIFYDCLWCGIQLLANFFFLILACLLFGFTNALVVDHGQIHP